MRLPSYDEIARVEEQLDIWEAPFDQSLLIAGPPGSGKTILAIHRAQMIASAGTQVVLVTFSRMLRRLIALLTENNVPTFTMHQFVGQQHYRRKTGARGAPEVRPLVFDWQAMSSELARRAVRPEQVHIIVDEGQDLPAEFFRYVRRFVARTVTIFADEDQALTDQRSSLLDIKRAACLGDPILLSGNHRNTPEVSRLAEHFHTGRLPASEVHRSPSGERPRITHYSTLAAGAERIANWFSTRGGSVGVVVVHNQTGRQLQKSLRDRLKRGRVDMYTSDQRNEDEIDATTPGITILNKESIKGQEFDTVFIMEVDELLPCTKDAQRRVMYMLCARARDNLVLMHPGNRLPAEVLRSLPGTDVLERP